MHIEFQVFSSLANLSGLSLFLPIFEDENLELLTSSLGDAFIKSVGSLRDSGALSGKFKEFYLFPLLDSSMNTILVGAGKREDFNLDRLRSVSAKASRIARRIKSQKLAIPVGNFLSMNAEESSYAVVEGVLLGLYRFDKYKNGKREEKKFPSSLTLIFSSEKELTEGEVGAKKAYVVAEAVNFTRDLVNEPSNVLTPTMFSHYAQQVAQEGGLEFQVLEKEEIEKLGMGAFLSVTKGSAEPPKLVILKYKGDPSHPFVLGFIGKGVTFDSGGISIKPAENMHTMTSDMAGAAACLGAMKAISKLKLPINVTAVLPLAENLPDGNAYKPGDIVKSFSGKTIEIINTDAEGRLLLCDALAYARTLGVSALVDLATLTGAVQVALGSAATGLFSNHEKFAKEVLEASERVYEPCWHMPLFEAYRTQMKGALADLKNSGGRYGGACTAAAFLREFVEDTPWVHLDIAGTALIESDKIPYQERPYLPKSGATGVGVRILVALAQRLSEKKDFLN
jgi:leucyl aminopeptidase